jgi:nitrobindin-like protein
MPDALVPLAWLIGEWHGEGRGAYPTIDDFAYRETSTFLHPRPDRPFLTYAQRTWLLPAETPSHSETGFLRGISRGRVELVLSQPSGVVAVHDGTITDERIELTTIAVARTPTAKEVSELRRVIERRGDDTLWYRIDMAAVGQARQYHCEATLHRAVPTIESTDGPEPRPSDDSPSI